MSKNNPSTLTEAQRKRNVQRAKVWKFDVMTYVCIVRVYTLPMYVLSYWRQPLVFCRRQSRSRSGWGGGWVVWPGVARKCCWMLTAKEGCLLYHLTLLEVVCWGVYTYSVTPAGSGGILSTTLCS